MVAPKASRELLEILNQSIAREIQVSVQYMWQHVLCSGVKGYAVRDVFKKIAVEEMKHAEAFAERLAYLGGIPTTKPTPIFVGGNLKEMLTVDRKDEEGAIALYRKGIAAAAKAGDDTTKSLFRRILAEEEEHHDVFGSLLEEE
jgi:bacterioferritin